MVGDAQRRDEHRFRRGRHRELRLLSATKAVAERLSRITSLARTKLSRKNAAICVTTRVSSAAGRMRRARRT
jgi:hypothetical protein